MATFPHRSFRGPFPCCSELHVSSAKYLRRCCLSSPRPNASQWAASLPRPFPHSLPLDAPESSYRAGAAVCCLLYLATSDGMMDTSSIAGVHACATELVKTLDPLLQDFCHRHRVCEQLQRTGPYVSNVFRLRQRIVPPRSMFVRAGT